MLNWRRNSSIRETESTRRLIPSQWRRRPNGSAIVRDYEELDAVLWADPDRLQQVVWNLLSNAIKFSPPKSSIRVSLHRCGSAVEIVIGDQGEGIDPQFLPHMFDRFRQSDTGPNRRSNGLGLGLSIVKHLVELHGGQVCSGGPGLGLGTRVTVKLPIAESPATLVSGRAARFPRQGVARLATCSSSTTIWRLVSRWRVFSAAISRKWLQ